MVYVFLDHVSYDYLVFDYFQNLSKFARSMGFMNVKLEDDNSITADALTVTDDKKLGTRKVTIGSCFFDAQYKGIIDRVALLNKVKDFIAIMTFNRYEPEQIGRYLNADWKSTIKLLDRKLQDSLSAMDTHYRRLSEDAEKAKDIIQEIQNLHYNYKVTV